MGAYYGLRRSEILGLKWNAIDRERKTISIQHTVVRVTSVMAENATKTQAGARVLNLFDTARSCLEQIRQGQDANRNFLEIHMRIRTVIFLHGKTDDSMTRITFRACLPGQ